MKEKIAIIHKDNIKYPNIDEFIYPKEQYEELNIEFDKFTKENDVFQMIRDAFLQLEYDKENFGTEAWNPLKKIIKPGNTVLIKPNLVLDINKNGQGEECLYTNPSLVNAVINYVWIALDKKGKIIVADAPVQSCNFNNLVEKSGYKKMIDFYKQKGVNIELKDLRGLVTHFENGKMIQEIVDDDGIVVDLRNNSEHAKLNENDLKKVRITNYTPEELLKHHNKDKHEYFIAKDALYADVIINMPKPKAHRKAGVTIGLKNFVGVNVRKEYLPHHRFGDVKHGGDEYSKNSIFLRFSSSLLDFSNRLNFRHKFKRAKIITNISKVFSKLDKSLFSRDKYREGSWHGNDTIWRTIIDINKIIKYADKNGKLCKDEQRKVLNIADMIVIGEKEGPLLPSPKYGGIIAVGENIVCFDEIIASIFGFDIKKIPLYKNIRSIKGYSLIEENDSGIIVSNNKKWNQKETNNITEELAINIEPSDGWKGYIEIE